MSRSRKRFPITGYTCSESEKQDKSIANRKFRRVVKTSMLKDTIVPKKLQEVSNIWCFSKDGKRDWRNTEYEEKALRK